MNGNNNNNGNPLDGEEPVSPDAVYSELYAEMRRFRDYALTSATWFILFLLFILGYILDKHEELKKILINNNLIKCYLIFLVILLGVGANYCVWYVDDRYHQLRRYTNRIEPIWKHETFSIQRHCITPIHFIYSVLTLLTFIILFHLIDIPVK